VEGPALGGEITANSFPGEILIGRHEIPPWALPAIYGTYIQL
jgi:hypothetical protein